MGVARTAKTLQESISRAAGADPTVGDTYTAGTARGMEIIATITNGATGPSAGCYFIIEISNDNTKWREWYRGRAGNTNNGVYPFPVELPERVMYARSRFVGNTGQAVTVECLGHELTSI